MFLNYLEKYEEKRWFKNCPKIDITYAKWRHGWNVQQSAEFQEIKTTIKLIEETQTVSFEMRMVTELKDLSTLNLFISSVMLKYVLNNLYN